MDRLSHEQRFKQYRDDGVILKATQYAKWTLPQLMVDVTEQNGHQQQQLERDYQEVGALFLNNLAAKMTALLFPATRQFFKVALGPDLKRRAQERGIDDATLSARFAKLELAACERIFHNASYNQLLIAAKHLVATGNALLYRDPDSLGTVTYGLQSFSLRRDGLGNAIDIVLYEAVEFEALSQDVQAALMAQSPGRYVGANNSRVPLYTRIYKKRAKRGKKFIWKITQEVEGLPVGEPASYPEHLCPYIPLHWNLSVGENYGRSHVEDYAGGFAKLSDLSEAAALYGIEIMKLVNIVHPGMGADVDELANSEVGEYVAGQPDSITPYEGGDYQKLIAVRAEIAEVVQNLARAFMYTGNTREGERVTAYEIRQNALEADNTLGGTYSSLAESWQVPLAHLLLQEEDPRQLAGIVDGTIRLAIVAGIPALGRAGDVQNLIVALSEAAPVIDAVRNIGDPRIDPQRVLDMILTGSGVDIDSLFYTEQEQAANLAAQKERQEASQAIEAAAGMEDTTEALQALGGEV